MKIFMSLPFFNAGEIKLYDATISALKSRFPECEIFEMRTHELNTRTDLQLVKKIEEISKVVHEELPKCDVLITNNSFFKDLGGLVELNLAKENNLEVWTLMPVYSMDLVDFAVTAFEVDSDYEDQDNFLFTIVSKKSKFTEFEMISDEVKAGDSNVLYISKSIDKEKYVTNSYFDNLAKDITRKGIDIKVRFSTIPLGKFITNSFISHYKSNPEWILKNFPEIGPAGRGLLNFYDNAHKINTEEK